MSEKNDSTGSKELQRILFKSQRKDVKTIWDKLPKEVQIYVFKKIREKNCVDLGQGASSGDNIQTARQQFNLLGEEQKRHFMTIVFEEHGYLTDKPCLTCADTAKIKRRTLVDLVAAGYNSGDGESSKRKRPRRFTKCSW